MKIDFTFSTLHFVIKSYVYWQDSIMLKAFAQLWGIENAKIMHIAFIDIYATGHFTSFCHCSMLCDVIKLHSIYCNFRLCSPLMYITLRGRHHAWCTSYIVNSIYDYWIGQSKTMLNYQIITIIADKRSSDSIPMFLVCHIRCTYEYYVYVNLVNQFGLPKKLSQCLLVDSSLPFDMNLLALRTIN